MDLPPTARSILGFLSLQERSGYEIREAARRSVGLIWGINDGQLYPQLRLLATRGLIEPVGEPAGPRSRQRWRLTAAGRHALDEWLRSPSNPPVLRDEVLVKLLFADRLGPAAMAEMIRRRQTETAALRAFLEQTVPGALREPPDAETGRAGPTLVHAWGLDFTRADLDWCDRALAILDPPTNRPQPNQPEEQR